MQTVVRITMKHLLLASAAFVVPGSHVLAAEPPALNLVPWPKTVRTAEGGCFLGNANRIAAAEPRLEPLAQVLSDEIYLISGVRPLPAAGTAKPGDIE